MIFFRRDMLKALTATPLTVACSTVLAQKAYPIRPVTLLVPQPAGGDADAFCRTLQPQLQAFLGQPVVVENRGGAAGNIGTALGARAAADGYTVTFVNQGTMAINPHLYPNPGFSVNQFIPVSQLASVDLVICAHPSVQANNLQELLGLARKTPDRLNYGTAGNGSANHMAAELLKAMANVFLTHIPFRGGGPAILSVLSGEIQLVVAFPLTVMQHIKSGKLKALAVTGATRTAALPAVPTVDESGVSGYEFSSWFGFALPKGTPDAIVAKVHGAAMHALNTPSISGKLVSNMTRPVGSGPKEFADLIASESAKWGKLIKQLGIKLD